MIQPRPRFSLRSCGVLAVTAALALAACANEDAETTPTTASPSVAPPAGTDIDDDEDCPIVSSQELASLLDIPPPELAGSDPESCLFSVEGVDASLISISRFDAAYGEGLLAQFEGFTEAEFEPFGLTRIEGIEGVVGVYSSGGFTVVTGPSTYQFAFDGTTVDRTEGMIALMRLLADR